MQLSPRSFPAFLLITGLLATTLGAAAPGQGGPVSYEDRLRAQEAIEKVYQSHRIRESGEDPAPIPAEVLESKVRQTLLGSAALERFWNTPVTADALARELRRIQRDTRFPGRLQEIFAALHHDPVLIQETFVRASLVQRLTRNFYAQDDRIHGGPRREIEDARDWLLRGRLDLQTDPRWSVVDLVVREPGDAHPGRLPVAGEKARLELSAEQFARLRGRAPARIGTIGPVQQDRDAFTVQVLLEARPGFARVGTYSVPKRSWGDWWREMAATFEGASLPTVASPGVSLAATESGEACTIADKWVNGQLDDIPEPRLNHTAIWTGSEMVVWGGQGIQPNLLTGGKYDPVLDSWIPTSIDGAPSARRRHTVIWTGTVMLVWGGTDDTQLNTGGRYDPATDTWSPMSTTNAPTRRTGHSAVWTGTEMIVWGGEIEGGGLTSGGRYNPATDTWVATGGTNVPFPRQGHAAVWTGSLMVIWGGNAGGSVQTGGRYDPVADAWTPTQLFNAPKARFSHTGLWTGSEMIVWGGISGQDLLDSGGRYDPVTDTWTAPTRIGAPAPRRDHTAIWTGTEMIIWGGAAGSNLNDGAAWDLATDSWTQLTLLSPPSARALHTAVWTGDSMIVWGGAQDIGLNTSGGRYHRASNTWTPTATPNGQTGREDHTAVWTGSEMIVFGGFNTIAPNYLLTGGRYDPLLDAWTDTSEVGAPQGRELHLGTWTGTEMVIWGGFNGTSYVSTGGVYDPVSDSWVPTSLTGAPTPRQGPSGSWNGTELMVWGGFQGSYLGDGARYNPGSDTWIPMTNVNRPLERYLHQTVWTGDRMILWGGTTALGVTNSGSVYDPLADTWTTMTLAGAPSGRNRHSSVWSGTEMIVWTGFDGIDYLQTGGRYNPDTNSWASTSLANVPVGRLDHSTVWSNDVMLIWGGFDGTAFPYRGDGARYDPVTDSWDSITFDGAPSPRSDHSAVWIDDSMIIWGGSDGSVLNTGGRYSLSDLPGEATDLALALDAVTLSWSAASGGNVTHDVLRGTTSELPVGAGGSESCIAQGVGVSTPDPAVPALGEAFWYLPRGANECGVGSYGQDSLGAPRTSATCP